jgi:hypothetical protein
MSQALIILPSGKRQEVGLDPRDTHPKNSAEAQWTNRFFAYSATSDKVYTIAQHKAGRYWGCDCNGWKGHKKCHHLSDAGLPNHMIPFEPKLTSGGR